MMRSSRARVEAEFVVGGGGSSGAAVAGRLAEAGRDVVLLEAGPDYGALNGGQWPTELVDARQLALTHDWRYGTGRWTFERARVIGGCSAHNGAIAAVGHRLDYDEWGLPAWTGDEVAASFAIVLDRMRVRAYTRDQAVPFHAHCLDVAEAMGLTIASDLCDLDAGESFGLETVNVVGTTRWNTAFAYLDPVRDRSNLRIVDAVLVDRFEPSDGAVALSELYDRLNPAPGGEPFEPHITLGLFSHAVEAEQVARIVERQHLPIHGRVEELSLLKRVGDGLDTLLTVRLGA